VTPRPPLSGILLLVVCGGLVAGVCHTVAPRPPESRAGLRPRPRWTPPASPSAPLPAWTPDSAPAQPMPTGEPPSPPSTAPPAAKTSAAPAPPTSIPGIDADGLLAGLSRGGLQCSSAAIDRTGLTWTCSAGESAVRYLVVLHGSETSSIEWLRASVKGTSDFAAVGFLQQVAALRYSDAEPARAQDWVRRTLATGGSTAIGDVRFELLGAPGDRTLDVAAAGWRQWRR
jgi:hypothetical protein